MTVERRSRSTEAFFGRRRGKTMRPLLVGALADVLPEYRIDLGAPPPAAAHLAVRRAGHRCSSRDWLRRRRASAARRAPGAGDRLHRRRAVRQRHGAADAWPRRSAARQSPGLRRRRDARPRLAAVRLRSRRSTCSIPTRGRRRSTGSGASSAAINLDRFARVLRPGGASALPLTSTPTSTGRCCTAARMARSNGGPAAAEDWRQPYPDWPGTRYEAKALREGRRPAYLTFVAQARRRLTTMPSRKVGGELDKMSATT